MSRGSGKRKPGEAGCKEQRRRGTSQTNTSLLQDRVANDSLFVASTGRMVLRRWGRRESRLPTPALLPVPQSRVATGKGDGRRREPTPAWGQAPALGTRSLWKTNKSRSKQRTCISIALAPAHFSFKGKTGEQDESPELRDRISGPREAAEEKEGCLETPRRGRKLPKVSLPRSVGGGGRL